MGDPMKTRSKIFTVILLLVFVLSAFTNMFLFMPQSEGKVVSKFSDGSADMIIDFPGTGVKYLKIPADANVTKMTVNFTTLANDNGVYPENIEMKLGEVLPIDWAYQGTGHGAFGNQRYFSNSQVRVNLTYDSDGYNDTLSFLLPVDADVSSASTKITAYEYDHWEPGITELNLPDYATWNQDPMPFVFQNRLWVFYRDYNSTQTSESDADISYNYTTDGVNWLQKSMELTPSPDTCVPYPSSAGLTHLAGDFHPYVVEFDGRMGVFWGSMSFYNYPNFDGVTWSGGLTNGTDRDIVARWYDPSSGWDPYVEITHPTNNANEENYTKNNDSDISDTEIRPWAITDQRPNAVEFKNKIYCIWMSNNTGNTTHNNYEWNVSWWHWSNRGDIIISSSDTGDDGDWSNGFDLTAGDRWWDMDFAPSLTVWNNTLFAMWETNGPRYVNESGNWTKRVDVETKYDWDLVYRYSKDGENWSDFIEMTPKGDTPDGAKGQQASIPDEDPRLISYTDPVTSKNRLYCIWRTRNTNITNGTDYDIVIRYTEDGINWTDPVELTDPETNGGYDNKPELTIFNNKLYVVWRREQGERWADNPDGDIVTRHWDGNEWSVRQDVSPFDGDGVGRDDFYANSIVFNNKFYVVWCTRNSGKGWTDGTDADVVIRSMIPSDMPITTRIGIKEDAANTKWLMAEKDLTKSNPSTKLVSSFKDTIRELLDDEQFVANNLWLDDFGNEMVKFNLDVKIGEPGRIRFDDLNIWYNCTLNVGDGETVSPEVTSNPFRQKLNNYIKEHQDKVDENGDIPIKLEVQCPTEGRVKIHDIFLEYNQVPTLKLLNPDKDTGLTLDDVTGEYTITWDDSDVDDNADISLYYHQGKFKKYSGTLITDTIKEDDSPNSYTWVFDEDELPDEEYSIFGVITDGVSTIYSYAPGSLDILWKKPEPPNIRITAPRSTKYIGHVLFSIEWEDSGTEAALDDGAKIYLYHSNSFVNNLSENANSIQIDINGDGQRNQNDYIYANDDGSKGQFIWDITHLTYGVHYYIVGVIDDGFNQEVLDCSDRSLIRSILDPPYDFKVESGKSIIPDEWETHSIKPELSWMHISNDYQFTISVWEGHNRSGRKIFEAEEISRKSIEILDENLSTTLQYGTTYYAEVFALGKGTRSGFKNITFTVVNNIPEVPEVIIVPSMPTSKTPLECLEPAQKVDLDGDHLTFTYRWLMNDNTQDRFEDIRTIPADVTTRGDVWTVEITPFDGIEFGPIGKTSVVIQNSLPDIDIENPTKNGEYFADKSLNIYTTQPYPLDPDGDEITVKWYLDLDDPKNITKLAQGTEEDKLLDSGGDEKLKFEHTFSQGTYNLTLFVQDGGIGPNGAPGIVDTIRFKVKHAEDDGEKSTSQESTATIAIGIFIIIIIIVVIIAVLVILRKRKPKTERESLYGKDKGLKPGEAYEVEDDASYFGDDLDRKGVSSLESGPVSGGQALPPETPETSAIEGTPKQPQLPPGGSAAAAPAKPTTPPTAPPTAQKIEPKK